MPRQSITDPDFQQRFCAKLQRTPNGCLEWQGCKAKDGYGRVNCNGRPRLAHRVAWVMAHGPIQNGLNVLHHCDNPACCDAINAGHLFLGTHADNMADMTSKGRHGSASQPGESNPSAKLTSVDVLYIRRVYVKDSREFGGPALGRRFGVSQVGIRNIVRRKSWQHV